MAQMWRLICGSKDSNPAKVSTFSPVKYGICGYELLRRWANTHPSGWNTDFIFVCGRRGRNVGNCDKKFAGCDGKGRKTRVQILRGVTGAWVKEHKLAVVDGKINSYQVNMMVTFVLED